MNHQEFRDRLFAAQKLFDCSATSREQIESLKRLVAGINPELDIVLVDLEK